MRHKPDSPAVLDVEVTTHGQLSDGVDYARRKIGALGRFTHQPVLHAHVKLGRHADPAVPRRVIAQANLDVNGRLVRAQVEGATTREAIDRLEARLRHQLEHVAEHWEARRGKMPSGQPHEWRHQAEPAHRPSYFPRPPEQRQIIRHKSFTLGTLSVDEAAEEMELLDYDFHLFTEKGTRQASVLYRAGSTGYRLAQVKPSPQELAPHELPVTVSSQPPPRITVQEAVERLSLLGLPFLFFIDAAEGRAGVLYHRYDGHYGLISPAG
ncbi:MAG: HPF/RaiA family ribosome-associated protein [Mycobacterium sp.]|uniref:ribosome hibernation promotion factor n=1 Tax=Mycobacterium sp. TaxID=1785 RepID=UPI0026146C8F|nr:HPF/RaiA family ribosome-associated protein [Mycobacterium sp.]MDI3314079.1 HPF/RaiA family ribosome-associated protein [Mycobacterium sp.]